MKLSVIIPVYNEKPLIQKIIHRILDVELDKEIIIVDDYSTDGTREILKGSNDKRIKVLFHDENYGKGGAVRTGLKNASSDWVIIQDADLEYDPRDYLILAEPIRANRAEVVYGSRFLGSGYKSFGFLQFVANRVLTLVTNILFGARLTDMETCYKMVPLSLMRELNLESNGFEIEAEITAKILRRKIRIVEVPISYLGRNYQEGKKIRAKDGLLTLFALLKYRFR